MSILGQRIAFATGVPPDIYAFHRYTGNSIRLSHIQDFQFRTQIQGWALKLNIRLKNPPTLPLRPVIPNNTSPPRITAAAGTKLAGASFTGTFTPALRGLYSLPTEVYIPKYFIPHMALLRQAFAHCAKFPTAASRRSLGRISVPMWPDTLSGRLPIVALVGRYPANWLMGRKLISKRSLAGPFVEKPCDLSTLFGISHPLEWLFPSRR